MNIDLMPYVMHPGTRLWSFDDTVIRALYTLMENDGTVSLVFYGHPNFSADDFLCFMKDPRNEVYIVSCPEEVLGFLWLNNHGTRSAQVHFCGFSNAWGGRGIEIGRAVYKTLMEKTINGRYRFDCLWGMTPKNNVFAINWLQKIGLTRAGEIPRAAYVHDLGESVAMVINYLEREV